MKKTTTHFVPFCTQLRTFRTERNLTARQAAGLISGLSPRTWQAWEGGQQEPPQWAQALVLFVLNLTHRPPATTTRARARKTTDLRHVAEKALAAASIIANTATEVIKNPGPWSDKIRPKKPPKPKPKK